MSTDLPPEAYTKETLQSAFDWLQTQPDVVRSAVHTPERLVSLYQKSQRLNDKDHPVSSKKFISDLKNLATSLDQFSGTPQSYTVPATPPVVEPMPKETPSFSGVETPKTVVETKKRATQTVKKASIEVTTETEETSTRSEALELDPVTMQRISHVQKRFNLSSANEAIRLLVALGHEKFANFD